MTPRVTGALLLALLTVGLASPTTGVALADEGADTTAPQVDLNPCHDGETSCRRVYAQVYGNLQTDDDLAVLGARIGESVLTEHVFDDGTGFEPYGWFVPYGNDVAFPVDYALSVEVPRGTSDITIYARDLEGNTSELTTTVLGPIPPDPVKRLTAELTGRREATVSWRPPDLNGSCCARYVVTTPGRKPKSWLSAPPSFGPRSVSYRRLSPGWHRFKVDVSTEGGAAPSRVVRLFVPPRRRG